METLRQMILERDKRLLALLALLFVALTFTAYKLATVFDSRSEPAYSNAPPAAFASQPNVTLVSDSKLGAPRLPDQGYVALYGSARKVITGLASLDSTSANAALQQAGMTPDQIRGTQSALDGLRTQVSGASKGTFSPNDIQLSKVTPNAAIVSVPINYYLNNTPLPVQVQLDYSSGDGSHWSLDKVAVDAGLITGR
jgi:hypothetical protein